MTDLNFADHTVARAGSRVLSGPNKLKLGLFGTNLSGGAGGVTLAEGPLTAADFDEVRRVALAADRAGIETMVPIARWKGFGENRPEGSAFWTRSFETMTWAGALLEATERLTIFSTCHVLLIHPIFAAKMGTTLDHISSGRWGLNVVAGWTGPEFTMYGLELPEHVKRYRYADEWMTIVERLWTEEEHFDHDGEFFKVVDGESLPKPVQDPYPLVMNAGSSGPGVEFAAKHANVIFINPQGDADSIRATVDGIKAEAKKDGKDVGVWAVVHVVAGDTEKEARDYVHYYAQEMGDRIAAGRYADALTGADSSATKALADRHPKELIDLLMTGGGPRPVIGTDQQVVDNLKELSDTGLDGLAFSFVDFEAGIQRYEEKLLPLMKEAGLRVE